MIKLKATVILIALSCLVFSCGGEDPVRLDIPNYESVTKIEVMYGDLSNDIDSNPKTFVVEEAGRLKEIIEFLDSIVAGKLITNYATVRPTYILRMYDGIEVAMVLYIDDKLIRSVSVIDGIKSEKPLAFLDKPARDRLLALLGVADIK